METTGTGKHSDQVHNSMSQDFTLQIESLIARLQPIRLEVLQAEQHFRQEINHVNRATFKARGISSIK
jgi:hypothetical protein